MIFYPTSLSHSVCTFAFIEKRYTWKDSHLDFVYLHLSLSCWVHPKVSQFSKFSQRLKVGSLHLYFSCMSFLGFQSPLVYYATLLTTTRVLLIDGGPHGSQASISGLLCFKLYICSYMWGSWQSLIYNQCSRPSEHRMSVKCLKNTHSRTAHLVTMVQLTWTAPWESILWEKLGICFNKIQKPLYLSTYSTLSRDN